MRKLAILTFQTLDGVMQAPSMPEEDTSGGFDRGGWAAPYWEEVMAQVRTEAMTEPYDMLFGRKTYELFAPHFSGPGNEGPEARMMNAATKYVASNTLTRLDWQNSVLISGDIPAEISALKKEEGPLLQIHGSRALIQTLIAHDLIDEFRLWTFPVLAGAGKCLFAEGVIPADLELIKTGKTPNGVVMGVYHRRV